MHAERSGWNRTRFYRRRNMHAKFKAYDGIADSETRSILLCMSSVDISNIEDAASWSISPALGETWGKQHATGSTTGYPSRNQRVDRSGARRQDGHQTASRNISKALSDTRRGHQVGPGAASSIL